MQSDIDSFQCEKVGRSKSRVVSPIVIIGSDGYAFSKTRKSYS